MALNATLVKTMRKLLRFGATGRATRIVQKLGADEIAGLFPLLPNMQRVQLAELMLNAPEVGEKLRLLPESLPALDQALASVADSRLSAFSAGQAAEVAAAVLRRLPENRRRELGCCLNPEVARAIDLHLPRGRKLGLRRPSPTTSFRGRITAIFSTIF